MTTIFWPFGLRPGVKVKWSKIFDHDHGQNFKFAVVKWSKLAIFDHDHTQNLWITGVKWSKLVNFNHWLMAKSRVSWSTFLTIDHGVNSRVSWSWSVPYPLIIQVDLLIKISSPRPRGGKRNLSGQYWRWDCNSSPLVKYQSLVMLIWVPYSSLVPGQFHIPAWYQRVN